MDLFQIILFVGIGLITGFISGLFGIGGGSIRIPLLCFAGMPLIGAFAVNMFSIPFSSSIGAFVQKKNINWKVVKSFTIGATLGIIVATFLVYFIPTSVLAIIFFLSAILTIIGLYLDKLSPKIYDSLKPTKINLFFGAFFANTLIGLRGGSGGTAFPPLLRAMHIKMHNAIATSLFVSMITSTIALAIYFFRGDINFELAIIVMIPSVIGSYIGSKFSMKTKSSKLKIGLALLVIILAGYIIYKEFLFVLI